MKKLLKIMAPVLVLAVGIGVVQAMVANRPEPEKKEEEQRLISLYFDQVRAEMVTLGVQTQGEVRPRTEIDLLPHVSGRVIEVAEAFAEGAGFDEQTTLLRIEDADYRLAVARAEAQVAQAKVHLAEELATAGIKRSQWEANSRGQEPTPLQVNQPQIDEARASLRSAEAQLADAQLDLDRTAVRVPFEGRVRERMVSVGQYVTSGTVLGKVFATDRVEVRLPLTDVQLMELDLPMGYVAPAKGGPAVTLSANVGGRQHEWIGRIVRTHAAIDKDTRLIHAVAEVNDPYGSAASNGMPLAVGLFVSAEIKGVQEQPAMVMPREALRSADKVYVINADEKLEIRTVEVLSTSMDNVYVGYGVSAGERVVTSPLPNAIDGMQVQAIERLAQL